MRHSIILPLSVLIRRVRHALIVEFFNHTVEFPSPCFSEPFCFPEPFDKRGAYRVICTDKRSAVPRCAERIVAITAQRPNLRTIIRTVNTGGDIASFFLRIEFRIFVIKLF